MNRRRTPSPPSTRLRAPVRSRCSPLPWPRSSRCRACCGRHHDAHAGDGAESAHSNPTHSVVFNVTAEPHRASPRRRTSRGRCRRARAGVHRRRQGRRRSRRHGLRPVAARDRLDAVHRFADPARRVQLRGHLRVRRAHESSELRARRLGSEPVHGNSAARGARADPTALRSHADPPARKAKSRALHLRAVGLCSATRRCGSTSAATTARAASFIWASATGYGLRIIQMYPAGACREWCEAGAYRARFRRWRGTAGTGY